jgi:hypothetical protein
MRDGQANDRVRLGRAQTAPAGKAASALSDRPTAVRSVGMPTPPIAMTSRVSTSTLTCAVTRVKSERLERQSTRVRHRPVISHVTTRTKNGRGQGGGGPAEAGPAEAVFSPAGIN